MSRQVFPVNPAKSGQMGEKFSEQINIAMEVHELLEFPRFVQFFLEGKRLVGWIFGTDGFIFALWE